MCNCHGIKTAKEENMTDNANYTSLGQAFSLGNGQESALNWLREKKIPVAVFLISGIKLEGVITSHDQYSLLLTDARGIQQLIYKAKISTITQVTASKPRSGRPFPRSGGRPSSPDQNASEARKPPQAS
jgi:host factor-I protein